MSVIIRYVMRYDSHDVRPVPILLGSGVPVMLGRASKWKNGG